MATDTKKYVRIGSINFELDNLKGWSPILAVVNDGDRCVLQITNWTGGVGTKPATGQYLGVNGLVDNVADGTDIRGLRGSDGGGLQYQFNGVDVGSPTSFDTMNFIGNVQLTDDGNVLTVEILGSPDAVLSVNNVFPDVDGNVQLSPSDIGAEDTDNKRSNLENPSNTTYPTTQAVVDGNTETLTAANEYAESLVVGLWDDRGNFDASGGAYPTTGGSGIGGAVLKGDIWTISVAGTLPIGQVVEVGDTVRALVDSPAQTQSNWAIAQNNIGYVPENQANKKTTMTGNETSNVFYLSAKAVYDWGTPLTTFNATVDGFTTTINGINNSITNLNTNKVDKITPITPATVGSATKIPVLVLGAQGQVLSYSESTVSSGATVLTVTAGSTVTLAANTDYVLICTGSFTLVPEALSVGHYCQLINTTNLSVSITYTLPTKTMLYPYGSSFTSNILRAWSQATIVQDSGTSTQMRYMRPSDAVMNDFNLMTSGGASSRITVAAGGVSANRVYTFADKDVNFGDLPSVATTNNNSISGTRLSCTGGSANTITGTDNSCLNSSNNTVSGSNNTVVSGGGSSLGNTVAGNNNQLNNCQLCTTNSSSTFVYLENCKNVDASNLVKVKVKGVDFTGYTTKNVQWCDGSEVIGINAGRLKAICALQTAIAVNTAVTLTQSTATTYTKPIAFMQGNGLGDYEGATHYVYLDIQNQTVSGSSKATYKVDVDNSTVIASQLIGTASNNGTAPTYTVAFTVTGTGANARLNVNVTISNASPSFFAMAIVESYYF